MRKVSALVRFMLFAGIAIGFLSPWLDAAAADPTVTVGPNVNLSAAVGNQSVGAIAIDPNDVKRVFVVSQDETGRLFAARTSDGGATWTRGKIASGVGPDGLPAACCNPSVSWDTYGNLFITYLGAQPTFYVVVAVSTDGGATFTNAVALAMNADQPTVATGPDGSGQGSVWVTYNRGAIYATGARVTGLGLVGTFTPPAMLNPTGMSMNYGDIAVGPSGQVMVTYGPASGGPGTAIYTNVKADGLGPGSFASAQLVTPTNVGGFTALPAQPSWGIDPEAGLAYDRSGGPHAGRVYLVYTDAPSVGSYDTDIFVRFSDDDGASWSGPVRVNDDATTNSQFLPRIALDQTTGSVAVTWYDTREDPANIAARYYGAISTDGGATFAPNFPISAAASSEAGADPPATGYHDIDFGDYTGSAFVGGVLMPVWADNSNSTADNPDGTLGRFDIYTAAVLVQASQDTTAPTIAVPGDVTTDATSTAGTAVTYVVQVTDPDNPPSALTWSCAPASGSVFPIGATTVTCAAMDPSGNSASASFTVRAKGAREQLVDLLSLVDAHQLGAGTSLHDRLVSVIRFYDAAKYAQAASSLAAFVKNVEAQTGKSLTPAQAAQLTSAASRIEAVLGY